MKFKRAFKALYEDAKEKYDIQQAPKLILRKDEKNGNMLFGRTAFYKPDTQTIVVYTTNRHPKDILRSYCHELIHHSAYDDFAPFLSFFLLFSNTNLMSKFGCCFLIARCFLLSNVKNLPLVSIIIPLCNIKSGV